MDHTVYGKKINKFLEDRNPMCFDLSLVPFILLLINLQNISTPFYLLDLPVDLSHFVKNIAKIPVFVNGRLDSFDVESLLTNVPISKAIVVLKERLHSKNMSLQT